MGFFCRLFVSLPSHEGIDSLGLHSSCSLCAGQLGCPSRICRKAGCLNQTPESQFLRVSSLFQNSFSQLLSSCLKVHCHLQNSNSRKSLGPVVGDGLESVRIRVRQRRSPPGTERLRLAHNHTTKKWKDSTVNAMLSSMGKRVSRQGNKRCSQLCVNILFLKQRVVGGHGVGHERTAE